MGLAQNNITLDFLINGLIPRLSHGTYDFIFDNTFVKHGGVAARVFGKPRCTYN